MSPLRVASSGDLSLTSMNFNILLCVAVQAPFAGAAMGEFWRNQGGRSLVIIDDLSSHAAVRHSQSA